MNIYLAAPWVHRFDAKEAAFKLEEAGHLLVTKWWLNEEIAAFPDEAFGEDLLALQIQARSDMLGVCDAGQVIILQLAQSEGKAVEMGIALSYRIPIMVVSPNRKRGNLFQYLPQIEFVKSIEEAIEVLK